MLTWCWVLARKTWTLNFTEGFVKLLPLPYAQSCGHMHMDRPYKWVTLCDLVISVYLLTLFLVLDAMNSFRKTLSWNKVTPSRLTWVYFPRYFLLRRSDYVWRQLFASFYVSAFYGNIPNFTSFALNCDFWFHFIVISAWNPVGC